MPRLCVGRDVPPNCWQVDRDEPVHPKHVMPGNIYKDRLENAWFKVHADI